jgi:hypothetical protein
MSTQPQTNDPPGPGWTLTRSPAPMSTREELWASFEAKYGTGTTS